MTVRSDFLGMPAPLPRKQQGVVLLVSLIFLLLLTLAATTTMQTSTIELRMSGNEEIRLATAELTQSIIDQVAGDPNNLPISGGVGYINCTPNVAGCTENAVTISSTLLPAADANKAQVIVQRMGPALTPAPRGINSSADAFFAARFEIDTTYDGTTDNEGKTGIVQGLMVLVPRGAQTN